MAALFLRFVRCLRVPVSDPCQRAYHKVAPCFTTRSVDPTPRTSLHVRRNLQLLHPRAAVLPTWLFQCFPSIPWSCFYGSRPAKSARHKWPSQETQLSSLRATPPKAHLGDPKAGRPQGEKSQRTNYGLGNARVVWRCFRTLGTGWGKIKAKFTPLGLCRWPVDGSRGLGRRRGWLSGQGHEGSRADVEDKAWYSFSQDPSDPDCHQNR